MEIRTGEMRDSRWDRAGMGRGDLTLGLTNMLWLWKPCQPQKDPRGWKQHSRTDCHIHHRIPISHWELDNGDSENLAVNSTQNPHRVDRLTHETRPISQMVTQIRTGEALENQVSLKQGMSEVLHGSHPSSVQI